ncbi:MAG TPA: GDP-mannose 4,6-dehydratase [Solirubrobacteraceae bacterium]|nr:GDP-mannose 4,6-dehydratase [Solirubrobacteraceae bacterium]
MRILITGASGFAGSFLARECARAGNDVVGISLTGELPDGCGEGVAVDLLDGNALREAVRSARPDVVYHLAALSSVGRSWEEPARTVRDNVAMSVNMLEALRLDAPDVRTVWVSTCEVYGVPEALPLTEDARLNPANPYAVSKATGDMLAAVYVDAHGLDLVRTRPFNHAGPEQRPIFVLSSLARQAAEAQLAGADSLQIVTGNPDTRRDFTDVRDVVRAYRVLEASGESGVFNVCTGRSISAADQVRLVSELIDPIEVEHVVDPGRVRAHEVMDLRGSHERLTAATGWEPEIPIRQTMADTIEWWKRELSSTEAPGRAQH